MIPLSRTNSRFSALLLVTLLLTLITGSLGCGNDDDIDGGASLSDQTIVPEAAYPDVELEVSFRIVPAAENQGEDFSWRVSFGDGSTVSGEGIEGIARHRYTRTGQFTIRIEALLGSDVAARHDVEYSVFDPVDISVDNVNGQPTNVQIGETLTVSSTITNQTAGPVKTPFVLRAYLSEGRDISRDDIQELPLIGETTRRAGEDGDVLSGGAVVNMGINAPVPEVNSGQYYVVVVVDPDNHVADRNLDDNLAISPNTIRVENLDEALPDISVQALEISPDRAFPELNRITRAFSLINLGNQDVFNVVHKTYLQIGSPELDEDALLLHTSDPMPLAGRQERTIGPEEFVLSEAIVPPADEEIQVYLIVEAFSEDGDVEEIRVDNNTATSNPPVLVSDQPVDGPDIAVHQFEVSPNATFLGGNLQVDATIANEGTEDVSSFFCGIYLGLEPRVRLQGDPRLTNLNFPNLAAGEVRQISRTITIPGLYDPGLYYFYLVCDPNGALNEPFRGNNHLIQLTPIAITDHADIDLYVANINLPDTAEDQEIIDVEATICVNGSNSSGLTKGALYAGASASVDFNTIPLQTFDIPNINPGECEEMTFQVQALCQDFQASFNVGIAVDIDETLPETNRENNRLAPSSPVTLSGDYCSCIEDDFSPNHRYLDAYDLGPGALQAAICKVGDCDYYAVELSEGDSLLVTTEFDSQRGSLYTEMLTPSGVQVLDDDHSPDLQQVGLFVSNSDQRYLFSVCGVADARNYYDLNVEVIEQPQNVDILPRDIDIPAQNTFSVGATIPVDLRIYNLGQEPTGPFSAEVILTTVDDISDPDQISLSITDIASINGGSYRDVTLHATLPAQVDDGDYYLAILLDPDELLNEDNRANNFGFSRMLTVETLCYDFFSPNHSIAQAAPLDPGSYSNLVACADLYDYYEICAPNGTTFSADVTFIDDDGDIDITLYNQSLEVIDSSAQSGVDIETVAVDYVNGDQCYYLRVSLVSLDPDAQTTYSMNVDVTDLPPELQCDSAFEPNDDFASATSLWTALQHESTLDRCPKEDTDFYQVQLVPTSPVTFRASLDPALQPGTLRLQLYRPNGIPDVNVETAPGIPTAEITNYLPPTAGQYFLQVTVGGDERRVTYQLEAEGLPGVDLAIEDLFIGPGTYHEGDEIRIGFDLRNYGGEDVTNAEYHVYLSTSSTLNLDDAQLLGAFTIASLEADETLYIDTQVDVPADHDIGTHFLHIFVDPDDLLDDVNRNNNRAHVPIVLVDPPASGD